VCLLGGNLIPMLSQKDPGCQEIQLIVLMIVYCINRVENNKMKFVFISFRRMSHDAVVW